MKTDARTSEGADAWDDAARDREWNRERGEDARGTEAGPVDGELTDTELTDAELADAEAEDATEGEYGAKGKYGTESELGAEDDERGTYYADTADVARPDEPVEPVVPAEPAERDPFEHETYGDEASPAAVLDEPGERPLPDIADRETYGDEAAPVTAFDETDEPEETAAFDEPEETAAFDEPEEPAELEEPVAPVGLEEARPEADLDEDIAAAASIGRSADAPTASEPAPTHVTEAVRPARDLPGTPAIDGEPLIAAAQEQDFLERWSRAQIGFVEDPQRAVTDAEALFDEILRAQRDALEARRTGLTGQWHDDQADTEDLRLAMRGYGQLVSMLLAHTA